MAGKLKRFLFLLAQEHMDFRLQELQSIVSVFGSKVTLHERDYTKDSPYLTFSAPSEKEAKEIGDRSVLIKGIYELLGNGDSYDHLKQNLLLSPELFEPYTKPDYTFAVRVRAYNKKLSHRYVVDTIEWLSFLPFGGRVKLDNPCQEFHVLEHHDKGEAPNTASSTPKQVYFGRLLSLGQRHLFNQYSLKNRHFIGNTSMDPQLAMVMANMGKVVPGSFVYDPFAGSGSILVACAHYGAYVLGSDIDWNIVHGKGYSSRSDAQLRGDDENVRHNLRQYSLEDHYTDMLVHDASKYNVWRDAELFDAIITDPPYGIREAATRVKDHPPNDDSDSNTVRQQEQEDSTITNAISLPEKTHYNLSSVLNDLIQLAAKFLVVGGRLVYWLPFYGKGFDISMIGIHPCLSLIAASEQPLAYHMVSRWLITMEKTSPYNPCHHNNITTITKDSSPVLDDFRHKYFQK